MVLELYDCPFCRETFSTEVELEYHAEISHWSDAYYQERGFEE